MSRIGKKIITIPQGVELKQENGRIFVKGPKGSLDFEVAPEIKIEVKEGNAFVSINQEVKKERRLSAREKKQTSALWGSIRSRLANSVNGVTQGYEKKLEIQGIGYKANVEGQNLVLKVGFTHLVKIEAPEGIKFSVEKNIVTVSGQDKIIVGLMASKIKKVQPPEPYKGKGIRYLGEIVRKKVGKKAAATAG